MLVRESSARRRIEAEMKIADAGSLAILKELQAESTSGSTMLGRGYDPSLSVEQLKE
ncbi:hypothetical protein [Phyllobacterium bourgognense]|uniref:hypothetical protein n=1 Tax=Phyllobacterium bourgognense TaxID=314236 RepID=UPI0015F114DC|nr:hypothetical protein [Phyllobacterium bourgognense]